MNKITSIFIFLVVMTACNNNSSSTSSSADTTIITDSTGSDASSQLPSAKNFESTIDGKQTALYSLKNGNMQVEITNYGARVVSIIVPDKKNKYTNE